MTNTLNNVPRELLEDLRDAANESMNATTRQHQIDHFAGLIAKADALLSSQSPAGVDAGLVEALEKLARLGNGDKYGNSDGNLIAQAALAAHRAQQVSVPDVSAMARILADRNADACNVNREDNWMIYGQDYIDDVTAMLAAAPSAGSQKEQG